MKIDSTQMLFSNEISVSVDISLFWNTLKEVDPMY